MPKGTLKSRLDKVARLDPLTLPTRSGKSRNLESRVRLTVYVGLALAGYGSIAARRRGHCFQSNSRRRRPPAMRRARERSRIDCLDRCNSGAPNSDFSQPSPTNGSAGHRTASPNPPVVTLSTIMVSRSISSSADSSQASQPQTGNRSVLHRPNRTCSPGKSETHNRDRSGIRVDGTEPDGRTPRRSAVLRAHSPGPSFQRARLRTRPPAGRASWWRRSCSGAKRAASVTLLYASSGGPPGPHPNPLEQFSALRLRAGATSA